MSSTLSLHWHSMPSAPDAQLQCIRWYGLQQLRRVQSRWSQATGKTDLRRLEKLEVGACVQWTWWKSPDEQSDSDQLCPLCVWTLPGGCALLSLACHSSTQQLALLLVAVWPCVLFVWCGALMLAFTWALQPWCHLKKVPHVVSWMIMDLPARGLLQDTLSAIYWQVFFQVASNFNLWLYQEAEEALNEINFAMSRAASTVIDIAFAASRQVYQVPVLTGRLMWYQSGCDVFRYKLYCIL